jgi:hypothetical protein
VLLGELTAKMRFSTPPFFVMEKINDIYLYPCRADFWAYASIMAINLGVLNTNSGVTSSGIHFSIQASAVQLESTSVRSTSTVGSPVQVYTFIYKPQPPQYNSKSTAGASSAVHFSI